MASLSDITAFQDGVANVSTLAMRDLVAFWRTLDGLAPAAVAAELRGFLPELFDGYVPLAAELGATFYEEARESAGVDGSYSALIADGPDVERVSSLAGWAAAPLFGDAPNWVLALSRLGGGSQRVVSGGARDTVELNTVSDKARPRFARHASANACAFCALTATRGAVYGTASAAGDGNKYHDHCHCVAVPVWGDEYEPPPYVKNWESAYKVARRKLRNPTTKDTLALMRSELNAS